MDQKKLPDKKLVVVHQEEKIIIGWFKMRFDLDRNEKLFIHMFYERACPFVRAVSVLLIISAIVIEIAVNMLNTQAIKTDIVVCAFFLLVLSLASISLGLLTYRQCKVRKLPERN